MSEPARAFVDHLVETKLKSRSFWSAWVGRLTGAMLVVASLAWMARLLWTDKPMSAGWIWQLCWAAATLFCLTLLALEHWRYWYVPRQRLREMIRLVRDGAAPIDELSTVPGAMNEVAADLQAILRELRQHKMEIATLQEEMRQRVARRTTAMERTISSLRNQATRDALTGLYNRRMLDQHLPQLIQQCRADRTELCVLMIDVDYFKQLNDTLGHAAGDELLKSAAQIIRSTLRDGDLAFRNGGDEFVVLLLETNPIEAKEAADRLVSLMNELAKPLRVDPKPALSIGIAAMTFEPDLTASTLLARADQALYERKGARARRRRTDTVASAV